MNSRIAATGQNVSKEPDTKIQLRTSVFDYRFNLYVETAYTDPFTCEDTIGRLSPLSKYSVTII
jgi:hypothetical protein